MVLNGNHLVPFETRHGLKQGDHVSPLLFVLVMEYFTRLMKRVDLNNGFRFHLGCKSQRLTCLAFPDDLLVFCKGHECFVQLVNEALQEFVRVSCLEANHQKSRLYAGGVFGATISSFMGITGFQLREFPMRYLGFLVSPKKME